MRILFYLVLFYLFFRLIKNALMGAYRKEAPRDHSNTQEEDMVLDPSCNTYISRGEAITENRRGNLYYFCCEECRKRFLDKV